MIRFLHFVYDDKFTKGAVSSFNKEPDIENRYIYYNWHKNKLRFVQEIPEVKIICERKEIACELDSDDYDVLYIHGLPLSFWNCLKYIPKDKIVIWWSWGYDIYSPTFWGGKNNYITIDILKPLTKCALVQERSSLYMRIRESIIRAVIDLKWHFFKDKFIKRVDYFQPVLSVEYDMMKSCRGFRAKEFYRPGTNPSWIRLATDEPKEDANGAILVCNSSSIVGNHLDVWKNIEKFVPKERKIIMPLSYGGSTYYADLVKKTITPRHGNIEFLDSFLPKSEYFNIVGQCTYFVHGSIRQHAMGNIFKMISQGVKIFLYKDSVNYRFLTEKGFVVFAVEDIDENSFKTPLTLSEHRQNKVALQKEVHYKQDIGMLAINELKDRISGN